MVQLVQTHLPYANQCYFETSRSPDQMVQWGRLKFMCRVLRVTTAGFDAETAALRCKKSNFPSTGRSTQ